MAGAELMALTGVKGIHDGERIDAWDTKDAALWVKKKDAYGRLLIPSSS